MLGLTVRGAAGQLPAGGAGRATANLADLQDATIGLQLQADLVLGGRVAVLEHVGACLAQGDLDVMGAVLVHADGQQARADTWRATGTERPSRGSDRASSSCTASSSPFPTSLACPPLTTIGPSNQRELLERDHLDA
jgi:hypothetical protein